MGYIVVLAAVALYMVVIVQVAMSTSRNINYLFYVM